MAELPKTNVFTVPVPLSATLCNFLGLPAGSSDSRANVSKAVMKYIKENNLMKGHLITVSGKLSCIIGESDVSVFTIQKCLAQHYNTKHNGPTSLPKVGGWSNDIQHAKDMLAAQLRLPCTAEGAQGPYQGTYVNGKLMC